MIGSLRSGHSLGMVQVLPLAATEPAAVPLEERQRELVRCHYAFVWRLLRRLGVPESDAEDAAQQVFIVATRRINDVKPGSERPFLFGTATRVASSARRTRARRPSVHQDLDEMVDPNPMPDELAHDRQRLRTLDQLLDQLPDPLRVVFVLSELEELSNPAIAELLDARVGTVASRLKRARELFREAADRMLAIEAAKRGVR